MYHGLMCFPKYCASFWARCCGGRLSGAARRGWGPRCGTPSLCSSGRGTCLVGSLPTMCCHDRGELFSERASLPSLPSTAVIYPLLWRTAIHLDFGQLPEGDDPYVVVNVVCLWEEVSSGLHLFPSWTLATIPLKLVIQIQI